MRWGWLAGWLAGWLVAVLAGFALARRAVVAVVVVVLVVVRCAAQSFRSMRELITLPTPARLAQLFKTSAGKRPDAKCARRRRSHIDFGERETTPRLRVDLRGKVSSSL